jgi:hypothetical protein
MHVQYPGGIAVRFRWAGSGRAGEVFGVSEAIGKLDDHGPLVDAQPDRLCRAELRVEGPAGGWTARLASVVYDVPQAVLWDVARLLLVKYGFGLYALAARTGELAWHFQSGSPIVGIVASSRLDHVLLQAEVETFALRADGSVAWRAAHNDVVTAVELLGGQLVLTSYGGQRMSLDARTGQPAD